MLQTKNGASAMERDRKELRADIAAGKVEAPFPDGISARRSSREQVEGFFWEWAVFVTGRMESVENTVFF